MMTMNLRVDREWEEPDWENDWNKEGRLTCKARIRKKAYVFCGKCKARGPIIVRTLEKPGYTRFDVAAMEIEAIEAWNGKKG